MRRARWAATGRGAAHAKVKTEASRAAKARGTTLSFAGIGVLGKRRRLGTTRGEGATEVHPHRRGEVVDEFDGPMVALVQKLAAEAQGLQIDRVDPRRYALHGGRSLTSAVPAGEEVWRHPGHSEANGRDTGPVAGLATEGPIDAQPSTGPLTSGDADQGEEGAGPEGEHASG